MKHSSPLDRVAEFMAAVCPGRQPGVVAVSGGPDSVALMRIFVELHKGGSIGPVLVAHLNHQLRGPESDADENFVQGLAKQLALPFFGKRVDVADLAQDRGENLESTARQVRYDWLAEVARSEGAHWVATGHTADDQAETLVHRLMRGTGLHGLGGIPPRRQLAAGIDVIRPLLNITRAELRVYLQEINQSYCTDSSNADLSFTRNRIRHELLPALAREFNPAIVSILCNLAEQAREVQPLIEMHAGELLKDAELPRAGHLLVFNRPILAKVPRHLVREMFRLAWSRESWSAGAMTFDDWDRLAALACREGSFDLPDGIHARSMERVIQLGIRSGF